MWNAPGSPTWPAPLQPLCLGRKPKARVATLQIVFNKLLQQGYSASLSTGVIHALHKGGDALQFENYRGITVGPVLAKVFAMILEARLSS